MTRIQSQDTLRKAKQGGDPLEADQRVAVPKEGEVNRQSAKECWASQTGLHDAVHTLNLPLSVCQNPNKGQGRSVAHRQMERPMLFCAIA